MSLLLTSNSNGSFVKGCQMPALTHSPAGKQQNSEGRRRTSLEGGNRGMYRGGSGQATCYGDLSGFLSFDMTSKQVCQPMTLPGRSIEEPMSLIFRCGGEQETWILRHPAKPSRIGSGR
jgi:hypothetical protein